MYRHTGEDACPFTSECGKEKDKNLREEKENERLSDTQIWKG
jgi:hypothetical protein